MNAIVLEMPWYLLALEISPPLYFGDNGGLPLKIIWELLDLATIIVLASGLYGWRSGRKSPTTRRLQDCDPALPAVDLG